MEALGTLTTAMCVPSKEVVFTSNKYSTLWCAVSLYVTLTNVECSLQSDSTGGNFVLIKQRPQSSTASTEGSVLIYFFFAVPPQAHPLSPTTLRNGKVKASP